MIPANSTLDLPTIIAQRFAQSIAVPTAFFAREEARIAEACWTMAQRFQRGGRLLAFGNGAQATDAQHVAVEFVHPVIVGKRALPALALTHSGTTFASPTTGSDPTMSFAHQLRVLAHPQDIAMGFALDGNDSGIITGLAEARRMGLLTLGLVGDPYEATRDNASDFLFVVNSPDPLVIQETHETLYHILWELVHIFFEHERLFV